MQYTKPYLPVGDQIALLESRGMAVPDQAKAHEYLSRIGYYRLSAYFFPFRKTDSAGLLTDNFQSGTDFKTAVDLYAFDKALRLSVLDIVERIEIAVRTQVALQLGQYDPWAHRQANFFDRRFITKDPKKGVSSFDVWLGKLDTRAVEAKDEFAVHFRNKYTSSPMPIWIAVELLDFGPLSHFLSGMRYRDQRAVAENFGVPDPSDFRRWVRTLAGVRNVCAHHARLWNKPLVDQPPLPKPGTIPTLDHIRSSPFGNRRLYAGLAISRYLLRSINPRTQWASRLQALCATFPRNGSLSMKGMGFPDGWEKLDLWS